jgi:hypothetical protein
MGVKYIHVNTKHLPTQNSSKFNITLAEPINHCTHVEVVGFSTQNDLYNVAEGNNRLGFVFRGGTIATDRPVGDTRNSILEAVFEIPPAFYTHDQMIEALETSMRESVYYNSAATEAESLGIVISPNLVLGNYPLGVVKKNVLMQFSTADGKTVIKMSYPTGEPPNRITHAWLAYRFSDKEEWHNSILNRLGFASRQVLFVADVYRTNSELFGQEATTTTMTVNSNYDLAYHKHDKVTNFYHLKANTTPVASRSDQQQLHAKTFSIDSVVRNTKGSGHLAFETHEALTITCDLISDYQSTTHNTRNTRACELTDTLIHIPITTNRASWIHYISRDNESVHAITKPTLQQFNIAMLSSHSKVPFLQEAYQSFCITLKITTKDDYVKDNILQYESYERGAIASQYERV